MLLASATHATDPQISALFHALRIPECTPCFKAPRRWPKKNKRGQEAQAHTSRSPPKKKPFARAAAVAAKSVQLCAAELLDGGASPSAAAAAADDASCYRLLLDDAADLRVGLRFSLSSSS